MNKFYFLIILLFVCSFHEVFPQTIIKEKIKLHQVEKVIITSCNEENDFKETYTFNEYGNYLSTVKERNGEITDVYDFIYKDSLLIEVKVKIKKGTDDFLEGGKTITYDAKGRILKDEMEMGEQYVLSEYKYLNDSTDMNHTIVDDGEFAYEEYIETTRSKYHNVVFQRTIEDDYVKETREEETIESVGMLKRITKINNEITRKYTEFLDDNGNPIRIEDDFITGVSKRNLLFNSKGLPTKEEVIRIDKLQETETHRCLSYSYEYYN